jgi:seryl-tRNA synthetase
MLDIKWILENSDKFDLCMSKRNTVPVKVEELIELNTKIKECNTKIQTRKDKIIAAQFLKIKSDNNATGTVNQHQKISQDK